MSSASLFFLVGGLDLLVDVTGVLFSVVEVFTVFVVIIG